MATCVLDGILGSLLTSLQGLALKVGGASATVVRRKYLKAEKGVDTLPLLVLAGTGPQNSRYFTSMSDTSGGAPVMQVEYLVGAALFAAGNRDAAAAEGDLESVAEQVRKVFELKQVGPFVTAAGSTAFVLRVLPQNALPLLAPAGYPANLDIHVCGAKITVTEPRGQ